MSVSYEFSVGSVRVREKSLLSNTDIEQLLACKSSSELIKILIDKGYGEGDTIDEILVSHTDALWEYLRQTTPDFSVYEPFIIQNDAHNLKVILKATMSGREFDSLLLSPYTIEPKLLKEAVEHRKFSLLPDWMSEPADRAYDIVAHKGDARECDAVIDKALMERILELCDSLHSEFLKEYFKTVVFYNDVKVAIRCARTGADREFLINSLCELDGFDKKAVINATLKGLGPLLDLLAKIDVYGCSGAIEQYKLSAGAFEKYVDNNLISLAKECCKRTSEGAEPILGYYLGCEAEKKVIHIISSGINTATPPELIRERLREIYG